MLKLFFAFVSIFSSYLSFAGASNQTPYVVSDHLEQIDPDERVILPDSKDKGPSEIFVNDVDLNPDKCTGLLGTGLGTTIVSDVLFSSRGEPYGFLVHSVVKTGLWAKAGIRKGDKVLKMNGLVAGYAQEVQRAWKARKKDQLEFLIVRNKKRKKIKFICK